MEPIIHVFGIYSGFLNGCIIQHWHITNDLDLSYYSTFLNCETSIYKPTDLWTLEDDLVFLKWCPNKRDRCYHAISRDLSARPHEILNLKIKDVVYRQVGNNQYAEVLVNGKTGSRHLPLIDSIPYVKEWLDEHPQRSNSNAYLICTMIRRNVGGRLSRDSLFHIYARDYKQNYFPMLLRNPMISNEDKQKIRDLLRKPWNLYIRSALNTWNIISRKVLADIQS